MDEGRKGHGIDTFGHKQMKPTLQFLHLTAA
jgi:hypothetical protein